MALPLPTETLATACSRIKPREYMSYAVNGKKTTVDKLQLNTANHAFYLGKIFPRGWTDTAAVALSGRPLRRQNIYSPEVIKGALSFLDQHLPAEETIQLVICRGLSELFNGADDTVGALSTPEAMNYLRRLAKSLHLPAERLKIVDMESEHTPLFAALRAQRTPLGAVDVVSVLSAPPGPLTMDTPDVSLTVARLLYREIYGEEGGEIKNRALYYKILATVPASQELSEEEQEQAKYYGLIEVAIRLTDVGRGRVVQGGVDRQGVYDDVISGILRGGLRGPYLDPIKQMLEGVAFQTLHLSTRHSDQREDNQQKTTQERIKNPFEQKYRRLIARIRTMVAVGLMGVSLGGAVEIGKKIEQHGQTERKAKQDQYMRDKYQHLKLKLWDIDHLIEDDYFEKMWHQSIVPILANNFSIPRTTVETLHEDFIQYMLSEEHNWVFLPSFGEDCTSQNYLMLAVMEFIKERELFLLQHGVAEIKPFGYVSSKMRAKCLELAEEKGYPPSIEYDWHKGTVNGEPTAQVPQLVGEVCTLSGDKYKVYSLQYRQTEVLLANNNRPEMAHQLNSTMAHLVLGEYVKLTRIWEALGILRDHQELCSTIRRNQPEKVLDPSKNIESEYVYNDPWLPNESFELYIDNEYFKDSDSQRDVLYARMPNISGHTAYSTKLASRFVELMNETMNTY